MRWKQCIALILICMFTYNVFAADTDTTAVPYGPDEFPAWQKDLRRAEIISFGAFPFVTFLASIYYDVYRYVSHDYEEGYRPWPFKNSDTAVALTEDEQKNIVYVSMGISVGVAVFDFSYRTIKRIIREREAEKHNREIPDTIDITPVPDTETQDN